MPAAAPLGHLARARVLVVPQRQAAKEDHQRVAENVANSPRVFFRPEKARGEEATRGGGSFLLSSKREDRVAVAASRRIKRKSGSRGET